MFNTWVRFAIIAPAGVFGLLQLSRRQPQGALLVLAAALLTYGYFRYGTVWLAFRAYRRSDLARTERLLNQIRTPGLLRPRDRAYYEFLRGVTYRARGQIAEAEAHLTRAAENKASTTNVRTFFLSQLAETQLTAQKYAAARESIRCARELGAPPFVQALIADLEACFPAA